MTGKPRDIAAVFSDLVKDPFHLSMEEIGRLTPYQVREIYFRSEDDDSPAPPLSEKEMFWRVNREWRGFPEEQVQRLWDEHLRNKKTADPRKPSKK